MKHSIGLSIALIASILLAIILVSGCTTFAAGDNLKAGLPDQLGFQVEISGGTAGNVTLTYEDLKALEFVKRSQVTYKDSTGNNKTSDFIGIPWNVILAKGGIPDGEAYFRVSAPDGLNVIYTREQADKTILAFKENDIVLTDDPGKDPMRLVFVGGKQCHWIVLPVKVEILRTNPNAEGTMPGMDMPGATMAMHG